MTFARLVLVICLCALLAPAQAQRGQKKQTSPEPPSAAEREAEQDIPIFIGGVTVVTTPVTVTLGGDFVLGLKQEDFKLFDNDKAQDIKVELVDMPLSMVILVGKSHRVSKALEEVLKTGIVFTQHAVGDRGEAAVVTFDDSTEIVQDFTNNADLIEKAVKGIKPGSDGARLNDAMVRALTLLSRRPRTHRKVIVVLAEDRDHGSETELGYVLRQAQIGDVSIYSVGLSYVGSAFSSPTPPPPPSRFPPGATGTRPGIPPTPTSEQQLGGNINFGAVLAQAVSGVKDIFFSKPLEAYAKGTGANNIGKTMKKGAIEEAVNDIAKELHSQYVITYRPSTLDQAGYHTIRVVVDRDGVEVRAKPGYFLATASAVETPASSSR